MPVFFEDNFSILINLFIVCSHDVMFVILEEQNNKEPGI